MAPIKKYAGTCIICLIALLLCTPAEGKRPRIHDCYSFSDANYDVDLGFLRKRDSFFLFYAAASGHGKYQNACSNSTTDYAGYFTVKDIKNGKVSFKIKSYLDRASNYMLHLYFKDSGDKMLWNIDAKETDHLPEQAEFKKCNNEPMPADNFKVAGHKIYLYNNYGNKGKIKGYILKGDRFEILERKPGWVKIKYTGAPMPGKPVTWWMKTEDVE